MKTPSSWRGRWRIVEMEVWGNDYLDLVVPAHITFDDEAMGSFQFGTVDGWLDCRFSTRDGQPFVEFSWEGNNDNDPGCGRGWAKLSSDTAIEGRLFIHQGDDSSFKAKREALPPKTRARKPRNH
jgi:hypothetical protein